MKITLSFILSLLLLISCEQKVVQAPAKKETDDFLRISSEREIARQKEESTLLNTWVSQNPQYNFHKTDYGYWINEKNLPKMKERNLEELDYVQYIKQYKNLNNKVIYSYQEIGIQNMIIGKTSEIRGIESVLRNLDEGDQVTLLLPSFMAYALYGDENKIGANQPIIVELEVLKVKKK